MYCAPGSLGCRDQLAGDRPGLVRGQEDRDECNLAGVHHAADGIAARRVRQKVLPLGFFGGYAQLSGARGEQAERDREEEDDQQRGQQGVPRFAGGGDRGALHHESPSPPPRGSKNILWVSDGEIAPRSTGIPGRGERGTARRL